MSKVFCIGLSKTGTTSLDSALRALRFRTVHYDFTNLNRIANGDIEVNDLKDIDAISDITVALNYKKLDSLFPGSKFIFTERDMDSWLISCEKSFSKDILKRYHTPREKNKLSIFKKVYNTSYYDKDKFIKAYIKHKEDVEKYFKNRTGDILFFNIFEGDEWDKLCGFLRGKIIEKKPFPNLNKSEKDD